MKALPEPPAKPYRSTTRYELRMRSRPSSCPDVAEKHQRLIQFLRTRQNIWSFEGKLVPEFPYSPLTRYLAHGFFSSVDYCYDRMPPDTETLRNDTFLVRFNPKRLPDFEEFITVEVLEYIEAFDACYLNLTNEQFYRLLMDQVHQIGIGFWGVAGKLGA